MASSRICSIPDCDKPVYGHDLCSAHYSRNRRNGDPFSGKTGRGKAADYLREVVLNYRADDCLIWPFARSNGYGKIRLNGKLHIVSRYVCLVVNGDPPSPAYQAAHSCGNGHLGCVSPSHLRWATSSENKHDKIEHGTQTRGESHPTAHLTEQQVRTVKSLLKKHTQAEVSRMTGINVGNVNNIARGKNWSHVSPD